MPSDVKTTTEDRGVAETNRRHEAACREEEVQRQREADVLESGFALGKSVHVDLLRKARFALDEARRTISVGHPVRVHIEAVLADMDRLPSERPRETEEPKKDDKQ